MARKRIESEFKEWTKNELDFCEVSVQDLFNWQVLMRGPEDSPYDKGLFQLSVNFNKQYPHQPPKVRFQTKIYHMNISQKGMICLPLLIDEWDQKNSMIDVFEAIYLLIQEPDPSALVREDVGAMYVSKKDEHDKIAIEWTQQFAMNTDENNNDNNAIKKDPNDAENDEKQSQ